MLRTTAGWTLTLVKLLSKLYEPADGEFLSADFRLIISPYRGRFRVEKEWLAGEPICVGTTIGYADDSPVLSKFVGVMGGLLVLDQERLWPSQPVAWIWTVEWWACC